MVFSQKLFSGNYFFVYASGDNDVVVLIHPNPDSAETLESEITDEEVFDNMGDDMLEEMEWKNGNIFDTTILAVGRNMKWMMAINLCLMELKKIIETR